jgi:hypothetical protein
MDDRFSWSTLRGSDAAHELAYTDALEEYERHTGYAADGPWRALLYIGTADVLLWDWLQPRLDYHADAIDLQPGDTPPFGNPYLVDLFNLARHLHGGPGKLWEIDLAGMIQRLPGRYYHVLLGALYEYRCA